MHEGSAQPQDLNLNAPIFQSESVPFRLGYRRWLDGLRGIAILLVLLLHAKLLRGGAIGVDLFFVLSGFLITSLLAEEWHRTGSICFRSFYARRMLRLFPAFFVLLVLFTGHTLWFSPAASRGERWYELAVASTYVANWNQIHGATLTLLGHTWSLSVEEQFYLIWPPLLYWMFRSGMSRPRILTCVVIGIVASATLRLGLNQQHRLFGTERTPIMRLYAGLDTRADALLAGCLAGLYVAWNGFGNVKNKSAQWKVLAGVSALGFCYATYQWDLCSFQYYDGIFTLVALCVAAFLIRMALLPSRIFASFLEFAPLVFLGKISYSLYLFHVLVFAMFGESELGWHKPGETTLALVFSVVVAVFSFVAVERPFLRLKSRFGLTQKPVATAVQPSRLDSATHQRNAA